MPSLMIDIGASVARLEKDVARANHTIDGFAKSAKAAFGAVAGYLGGAAITSAIRDVTTSYMEQERAVNKMGQAMKNQGDFSKAALQNLENYASQIQETTTVADDAALSAMANLKSYGMLNDEVKRATQVAVDFAAAKKEEGMTVVTASELIGKAYVGSTATLGKYGIVIGETLKGAEKFEAVMQQLQARFGGAAQAELETYAGQWTNLNNAWGDAKEDLGKIALELGATLHPALKSTVALLKEAAQYWRDFMDVSAKGTLQKRQQEILGELGKIESKYPNPNPNYFGQDTARFPADVEGRYQALNRELQTVTRSIQGIQAEDEKVFAGGKRTAPAFGSHGEAEREKWLSTYLKGVDQAVRVEQERSEVVGELYMLDVKWAAEANDKQLKQEQEYLKTLDDIKLAQAEGEAQAREEALEKAKRTQNDLVSFTARTAEAMQDNFSSLFLDVMQGKLNDFSDYAKRIFQSIQQAAADYLGQIATDFIFGENGKQGRSGGIFGALLNGTSALTGQSGGDGGWWSWLQTAGSIVSMVMHEGGTVGSHSKMRLMPAFAFSGAPRLHSGLGADEFPAILERGEKVIPKDGGGSGDVHVHFDQITIQALDAVSVNELLSRNPNAVISPFMEALKNGGQIRNMIRNSM